MSTATAERKPIARANLLVLLLLGLFLVIITRRAWIGDDAYITFRTVDNVVHGFSLTWNPGERVQAYTHPLWMMLLSVFYFVTHEIYFTSVFVSLAASLAAVAVFAAKIARSKLAAGLGILVLGLSNAFVDYSTSGLENPLTHLLLAVFLAVYFTGQPSRKRLFWLSAVASLAAVNRLDSFVLYVPALIISWWEMPDRKRALVPAALGQAPLVLWELFSLVYYGFLFPNTAYAKLNTGVPSGDLIVQGLFYFINSLDHDPLTLLAVACGVGAAFASRNRRNIAVGLGVLLYLLYIVKIGGDFMGGRFFSAPLFCAVALVSRLDFADWQPAPAAGLFAAVLLAGLIAPLPTYRVDIPASYSLSDEKRINDERAWYFKDVNLLGRSRQHSYPTSQGREGGLAARAESQKDYYVVPVNNIGLYGYYAGPKVYVIDEYALADPLLARLPAAREANFYIGHFHRVVPDGYIETLYSGRNQLKDENLAKFYDQLRLIVRGPLFSARRWAAIWKMNTGQLNALIDTDRYRYPDMAFVQLEKLSPPQASTVQSTASAVVQFNDSGVEIDLGALSQSASLSLELDSRADFQVVYLKGKQALAQQDLTGSYSDQPLYRYLLAVPPAARSGFDRVRVFPVRGGEKTGYHLGGAALAQ